VTCHRIVSVMGAGPSNRSSPGLNILEPVGVQALIRNIGVNLIPVHIRHSYDSITQILDIISKLRQFDQEPYESYSIILAALVRHAQLRLDESATLAGCSSSHFARQAFAESKRTAGFAVSVYSASWQGSQQDVASAMGVTEEDIVFTWFTDDVDEHCPKFMVLIDHQESRVVLVIRGTFSFKDVIMDVVCEEQAFHGGFAHKGFLEGAMKILHKSRRHLVSALSENNGYSLFITGHSMGGATAELILLELLLGPMFSEANIYCLALGPPPVFRGELPFWVRDRIKIFVNNKDVVPRLSLGSVAKLVVTLRNLDSLGLTLDQQLGVLGWGQGDEVEMHRELVDGVVEGSGQERFPYLGHPGRVFLLDTVIQPGRVRAREETEVEAMAQLMKVEETMITDHVHTTYRDTFNKQLE